MRQVLFDQFNSSAAPTEGVSMTGTMNFDGNGNYSFTGQLSTSTVSSGTPQSFSTSGSYAITAGGLLRMDDPLSSGDSLFGGVGNSAFVASATESQTALDLMVGVPIASSVSNAALSGQYRVGSMDITNMNVNQYRNASFLVNADGNGNLGTVSLLGQAANNSDTEVTQTVNGATYTLNGTNNTMTFPLASGASNTSQLVSGPKAFAVSSDGNIFIGGGLNTYDFIIGIKSGSGNNSSFSGTYYSGGMDYDSSYYGSYGSYYVDAFYGSVTGTGSGVSIAHQRVSSTLNYGYDYTIDDQFTVNSGGVTETYSRFFTGAGGTAVLSVGRSSAYSLELSILAKTVPQTGSVVINPLGIVNAANYVPPTNPVAPGEMVYLYGSGLASSSATASSTPLPTSLGNVSVTVNGTAAPIYQISPTKLVVIVPWELDPTSVGYAQFQVTNSSGTSNTVTMFVDSSAPGVFTVGQNGIGDGAVLHANGSVVSSSNPAKVGETISVYTTGLGAVSPSVSDGAPAPANGTLTTASDSFTIYVDGTQATTSFSGLAPGFVGLYQINFTVPSISDSGEVFVDISDDTNGAYNTMATMFVGSGSTASALPEAREQAGSRVREKAVAMARKGPEGRVQSHTKRGQ
ncbi:MAG: hypothetical protein JO022_12010 [Acidobacteriaceae bacterium]|nr:hypothetical protein [Acidobacteriaceae bacterium]